MKRIVSAFALAFVLLYLLAGPIHASNPHYSFNCYLAGGQYTLVIEQQTTDYSNPVVNPGVGVWSGYDNRSFQCGGSMGPGASDEMSQQVVEDNRRHPIRIGLFSTSSDLVVVLTITEEDGAEETVVQPTPVKGGYEYRFETYTESYADLSTLPEIAGSNGGRGELVAVSLSVMNPTDRTIRGYVYGIAQGFSNGGSALYIARSYGG